MSKRTKVLVIVAVLAVAVYLGYRYLKSQQSGDGSGDGGQNPEGLGSNLNSPAPLDALNAAPSVGPAVSIPLSVSITHSDQKSVTDEAANPYSNMVGRPPVTSPLVRGRNSPGAMGRASRIYSDEDLPLGKSGESAYATTYETG